MLFALPEISYFYECLNKHRYKVLGFGYVNVGKAILGNSVESGLHVDDM